MPAKIASGPFALFTQAIQPPRGGETSRETRWSCRLRGFVRDKMVLEFGFYERFWLCARPAPPLTFRWGQGILWALIFDARRVECQVGNAIKSRDDAAW